MANVPAPWKDIGQGVPGKVRLASQCSNPWCDNPAREKHHAVRRSHVKACDVVEIYGVPWPNLVGLCGECHLKLELNHAVLWALELEGKYVWRENAVSEFLSPHPVLEDGESAGVFPPFHAEPGSAGSPSSNTGVTEGERGESQPGQGGVDASSPSVTPGETCPECKRRVPHPRKASSPKTTTLGFRVPTDEKESIEAAWLQRAERMGISRLPHWRKHYLDITNSLIDGLSDDVVRNIGKDYLGDL